MVVLFWVGVIPLTVISAGPLCSGSRRRRETRGIVRAAAELERSPAPFTFAPAQSVCVSQMRCEEGRRTVAAR
jgi:hypothetical protein